MKNAGEGWTCFHCGEHFPATFAGQKAAALHFGATPDAEPGCMLKVEIGQERKLLRNLRRVEFERDEMAVRLKAVKFGADEDECVARFMAGRKILAHT